MPCTLYSAPELDSAQGKFNTLLAKNLKWEERWMERVALENQPMDGLTDQVSIWLGIWLMQQLGTEDT